MTYDKTLFDPASFRIPSKPIPLSLGDDSEIFATGKGTLRLMFNVDGKKKEGQFEDVLYGPKLKVTLQYSLSANRRASPPAKSYSMTTYANTSTRIPTK